MIMIDYITKGHWKPHGVKSDLCYDTVYLHFEPNIKTEIRFNHSAEDTMNPMCCYICAFLKQPL